MFGQPVAQVMSTLTAAEFRAWAVWRKRNGLVHRHTHYLLADLAWRFACLHRPADSQAPSFASFYPRATPDDDDAPSIKDDSMTPEDRKTLATLMSIGKRAK